MASRRGLLRGFLVGGVAFALLGLALLAGGIYVGVTDTGFADDTAGLGLTIAGGTLLSIGVIWAIVAVGVGAWYRGIAVKRAAESELLRTGTRATGVIENVEMTATTINENPVVEISVRVQPRGEAEFVHRERLAVPASGIPLPGHLIDVAYDPANRARVALAFDERLSAPPARYLITRPPGQAAVVPAAAAAASAPSGGDRIEDLERLAELKRSGVLSDAEFEAEKKRILGS